MGARGEEKRPRALGRHRGHAAAPRHRGVYHHHRQVGWHPHPHQHAAHRRLAEQPPHVPMDAVPAPLHHHQHTTSDRHLLHARRASSAAELGQIAAYDAATGTAMVLVLGSTTRLIGPVQVTACAPRDLTMAGAWCLVDLLDAHNPQDGVVVAIWPAAGAPSGAKLTQAGVASLGVSAASTASAAIAFPAAYGATPVVVATSTDPSWAATVAGITTSGFTLTIRAAAPLTATVEVEWMASG